MMRAILGVSLVTRTTSAMPVRSGKGRRSMAGAVSEEAMS